jgi:DNA ligase (NAD+)
VQLRERIKHYASRQAMDIKGLGEKRSQQLVDNDLIKQLSDLYSLTNEDLLSLEGYGKKSANNLLDEIESSKETTFARFLYGLGIPLVGLHLVRVLTQKWDSLDELMEASSEELEVVDEIGPQVARSIVTYFADSDNQRVIEEIRDAGLTLANPNYSEDQEQPLQGLKFVFTGEMERWKRDEVKRYVERLGGSATSSVSNQTDYVVAGPGAGSKLEEALEQDIEVMDEQEFVRFVEKRCG